MGVHAAPETSPFTWLSDEDVSWILSFLLTLSSLPTVAAVSCRLRAASRSPGAWEGALVDVPTRALADEQCMEMLAALCLSCWSRAKEVRLPAGPRRLRVQHLLSGVCPDLLFSVAGDGPHMFFVMAASSIPVGSVAGLRFFEPRYLLMCQRLLAGPQPPVFGWLTSGRVHVGATGSLCSALEFWHHRDGSFNVKFRALADFSLLEVWAEAVPGQSGAPKLLTGYVELQREAGDSLSGVLARSGWSGMDWDSDEDLLSEEEAESEGESEEDGEEERGVLADVGESEGS